MSDARIDRLEEGIAELRIQNETLGAQNEQLRADNEALRTALERAHRRMGELERRLSLDSSNSHKPPSSDPPWKARPGREQPVSKTKKTGRKSHAGHHRERLEPTRVHELYPSHCRRCGAALAPEPGGKPWVHQVTELGDGSGPQVDEYRRHEVRCPRCGGRTRAERPSDIPSSAFGPRLQAVAVTLLVGYRLSRRMVLRALEEFWGVRMSLGALHRCEQRLSKAAEGAVAQVRTALLASASLHIDETGWRRGKERPWLWVQANAELCTFFIEPRRNKETATRLLDGFKGLLCSDDFGGYRTVPLERRQMCWAHRMRDFEALSLYRLQPRYARVGRAMKRIAQELFHLHHRVRDGTMKRAAFVERAMRLQRRFERVCRGAIELRPRGLRRKFKKLLSQASALWRFVHHPELEPTNNRAEQALRHAVIWRRIGYGHRSEAGRLFVERMLTVVQTLGTQRRSVLRWLTALAQGLAPSLVPAG